MSMLKLSMVGRFASAMIALVACAATAEAKKLKYDPNRPLVVAPAAQHPLADIEMLLDKLFAAGKPVVFYIHGRGTEPDKSRDEQIISNIERDYDVKVLMFNWKSNAFGVHRPVKSAKLAAPQLVQVFGRLAKYRQDHPQTQSVPLSLLVHSMGNIVLRQAEPALEFAGTPKRLFENILMTGSDADAENHANWIQALKFNKALLITLNSSDQTLGLSIHLDGSHPLGRGTKQQPLADNARYLDMSGLVGGVHRIFAKSGQHHQVSICRVLTSMLRGEMPNLAVNDTISRVDEARIFIPIDRADKQAPCFAGSSQNPFNDKTD